MLRKDAIAKLQTFEPRLRAMGAAALFLGGSTARGNQTSDSDVDVFLDLAPGASFTLFDQAIAQRMLTDGLAAPVDLTVREDLSPKLQRAVFAEAIKVF